MEIKKVGMYKNGAKIVIIPKKSDIEAGDFVVIEKLNEELLKKRDDRPKLM